jgi:DNA-binding transcriptional LysR family regulator
MKHKIINYFPYVDDVLIIFDPNHASIQTILADFNTLHPNLQFTAEMEENNTITYLDITIHRTPSHWKTAMHRKPLFTDTIIPYMSNHPLQHNYAAVKFLYNRLHTYNLQPDEYLQEENTIHNISYNSFLIKPHKPRHPKPQKQ